MLFMMVSGLIGLNVCGVYGCLVEINEFLLCYLVKVGKRVIDFFMGVYYLFFLLWLKWFKVIFC